MKYKPKIKHRLKAAVMAAFLGLTACLTSLSASALWEGLNGGVTGDGGWTLFAPPFSHETNIDQFAWRVDLYVSANADGKINKPSDTIGSTGILPLVGSLFCTSEDYVKSSSWDTYIQTNFTNNSRDQFDSQGYTVTKNFWTGDISGKTYTLPTLKKFEYSFPTYTDTSSNTVAIATKGKVELFNGQYKVGSNFDVVSNQLMTNDDLANQRTTEIITQIESKIGEEVFLKNVIAKINSQVRNSIAEKIGTLTDLKQLEPYLLPTGSDCMVEWAMVVTPLYRFTCNIPFYHNPSSSSNSDLRVYNGLYYFGGDDCVALDAYWMGQYNKTTCALGAAGYYNGLSYQSGSSVKPVWQIQSKGLLPFFLEDYSGLPAAAAYCTQPTNCYLGVYNNNGVTEQSDWRSLLGSTPSEYAKRGGIAIFTTKIQTPETPVYYHTYTYTLDENNPPDGYNPDQSYTQEQLLQFVEKLPDPEVTVSQGDLPDKNAEKYYPAKDTNATSKGTVTEAMTPSPTIKQPGLQTEYPTYNLKANYLEKLPEAISSAPVLTPLAADKSLKTNKATPTNTADDPKEFHVKIIKVEIKEKTPPPAPSNGTATALWSTFRSLRTRLSGR